MPFAVDHYKYSLVAAVVAVPEAQVLECMRGFYHNFIRGYRSAVYVIVKRRGTADFCSPEFVVHPSRRGAVPGSVTRILGLKQSIGNHIDVQLRPTDKQTIVQLQIYHYEMVRPPSTYTVVPVM